MANRNSGIRPTEVFTMPDQPAVQLAVSGVFVWEESRKDSVTSTKPYQIPPDSEITSHQEEDYSRSETWEITSAEQLGPGAFDLLARWHGHLEQKGLASTKTTGKKKCDWRDKNWVTFENDWSLEQSASGDLTVDDVRGFLQIDFDRRRYRLSFNHPFPEGGGKISRVWHSSSSGGCPDEVHLPAQGSSSDTLGHWEQTAYVSGTSLLGATAEGELDPSHADVLKGQKELPPVDDPGKPCLPFGSAVEWKKKVERRIHWRVAVAPPDMQLVVEIEGFQDMALQAPTSSSGPSVAVAALRDRAPVVRAAESNPATGDGLVLRLSYELWQPLGNPHVESKVDPLAELKVGSWLNVAAKLQANDGGPASKKAKKITFTLREISNEPGMCINWPPHGDTDPDFDFDRAVLSELDYQAKLPNTKTAETRKEATEAAVKINCFDYGAYADLEVTAEIEGQRPLQGRLKDDPNLFPIPLPKRQPGSRIADKFKQDVNGQSVADDDDSEKDGLTFYEEYRGAHINGKWQRLIKEPKDLERKKLFVHNLLADKTKADRYSDVLPVLKSAFDSFEKLSGVRIIPDLRADEYNRNRVINFNSSRVVELNQTSLRTGHPSEHGQGIIRIRESKIDPIVKGDRHEIRVVAQVEPQQGSPGYHTWLSIDLDYFRQAYPLHEAALLQTIVHELGHCVNIPHHASPKSLVDEVGFQAKYKALIAVPQGRYSGNWYCPMRYRYPQAYAVKGSSGSWEIYVWSPTEKDHMLSIPEDMAQTWKTYEQADTWEIRQFCTSPAGTEFNTEAKSPGAAGSGGCMSHLQVKDEPGVRPAS
jgi:hypothetical protein